MDNISLVALRNRDHDSWKKFMKQLRLIAAKACNQTSDDSLLDEVVQESAMAFAVKLNSKSFKLTSKLSTFMYSIARNQFLKSLGKRGTISTEQTEELENEEGTGLEHVLYREELFKKMESAFDKIDEKCKKILTAFYYEKKKMSLIAIELGYANSDAAKNIKGRCFKSLKETCLA